MTTPIKTQCPHCHVCFKVPQNQLNKAQATVNCDHCQQRFLVNKNLIVISDAANTQADITKTNISSESNPSNASTRPVDTHQDRLNDAKSSLNKPHSKDLLSDTLIHDDLIYDDMDNDGSADIALEYNSLDSMNAWLTHANQVSTAVDEPSHNPYKTIKNSCLLVNSSSSPAIRSYFSSEQAVLSSTAANDIHATIDNASDNSWLEKLLIEQNRSEDTPQSDIDLSQLLLDMGVPLKDENNTSEKHIRKAQERFLLTSEKYSIASLLWTLGCLVLALLLFAQYVIFNLNNLVKNPVYAQRLQAICSVAACSLPSADLSALTITNSSHKASQVQVVGTFSDVSATLNNQSAKSQLYPNVKVSVYGANDLIGEFIAAPSDYLSSKQSQLAAKSDRQLLLTIPIASAQIREVTLFPLY